MQTENNLAAVYQVERKYAQAELLYARVVEVERRLLGEEHPDTLTAITNLASLHVDEGKYPEAEALFMEVLKASSRLLGEQHPDTLKVTKRLADVYGYEGQYARAEVLYAKVIPVQSRVLGSQHPGITRTMASLGWVRLKQQKYSGAEVALRDVLKTYEKIAPDWERYNSESMLGTNLVGQKKYTEAEPLLLSGYAAMLQRQATIPAGDQSALKDAKESILRLYEGWGKPDKAAEWKKKLQIAKTGN